MNNTSSIGPLVSVIIPNYNNEAYIIDCLKSCASQTYQNLEIIVVDDCSTDKSRSVVEEFCDQHQHFRLVCNSTNLNVSRTRNKGIRLASGDWITTLDGDDVFLSEEKIEKEMSILRKFGLARNVMAFSGVSRVSKEGAIIQPYKKANNLREGSIHNDILSRNCQIPRDFIFHKSLFEEIGGFDPEIPIYEDWDFKIRLSKIAYFHYTGQVGVGYRQHTTGLSKVSKKQHVKWIRHVFDKNSVDNPNRIELEEILFAKVDPSLTRRILNRLKKLKFC